MAASGFPAGGGCAPSYVTPAVAEHFEPFNLETFNGVLAAAERIERLAGTNAPAAPPS